MKKIIVGFVAVILLFSMSFGAWFESKKVKEQKKEIITFVNEAADYYNKVGGEKAIEVFNDKDGGFQRGELYVFIVNYDGTTVVHVSPKIVGKNVIKLRDSKKKQFIQEFIEVSKSRSGEGWVDYYWTNPKTKKVGQKISYVKRLTPNSFISAGVYKQK